jgi:NADPH:quinone reductase
MPTTYRAVMITRPGGPEVLQTLELPIVEPEPGELRVAVRASGVGATDLTMLAGDYMFAPKIPFVGGYEIAGVVEAVGADVTGFRVGQRVAALTVHGGFAERLVRGAEHFVPIPDEVGDVEAVAVILNYVTAWQMIHRVAKVRTGQTALVTGAGGGVGTALLQLLRLAGIKTYGAASAGKHGLIAALGATPVFDAIGGANIGPCLRAARRGGMVVGYGFMAVDGTLAKTRMFWDLFVGARLRGRRGTFYGITLLYRKDAKPFHEDLQKIFALVARKQVSPVIAATFPLLEAGRAVELLATGSVEGKIVLTCA